MATEQVITEAVDRAVETANIDADAPRELRDERCRSDPDALAAVIGFCDSAKNRDLVIDVVDRALPRWIGGLEIDRTLAAVMLRERITAATDQRQVIVEDVQGDVAAGRGPLTRHEQRWRASTSISRSQQRTVKNATHRRGGHAVDADKHRSPPRRV